MPRVPASTPSDWRDKMPMPHCDPRLPEEALTYRRMHALTDDRSLGAINVTAWLYRDEKGREHVQVNPNIPISELRKQNVNEETRTRNVGFHSEFMTAEWFRTKVGFRVLQIFTERVPCSQCADFLRTFYRGVPCWYYYIDRKSLSGTTPQERYQQVVDGLRYVYGLK